MMPALVVSSFVQVSIFKLFCALTVLKALLKLTLISISVYPDMYTISISFSKLPFSNIAIPFSSLPHPRAVLKAIDPLSFIKLAIRPLIFPNSFGPAIDVASLVYTAVRKTFIAFSVFQVTRPLSFIKALVVVKHHSQAMPLIVDYFPVKGSVSVFFQFQMWGVTQDF